MIPLLTSLLLASASPATTRVDRFSVGLLGGAMYPTDSAYDTTAPELGVTVGYSPEWRHTRLDLSIFATAGRSGERGFSAIWNWVPADGSSSFFIGGGAGLAWLGLNYALENEVGWHLVSFPEEHPHAPFIAADFGVEFGRFGKHPVTVGTELHFPFDYLKVDVRFPSALGVFRVGF